MLKHFDQVVVLQSCRARLGLVSMFLRDKYTSIEEFSGYAEKSFVTVLIKTSYEIMTSQMRSEEGSQIHTLEQLGRQR